MIPRPLTVVVVCVAAIATLLGLSFRRDIETARAARVARVQTVSKVFDTPCGFAENADISAQDDLLRKFAAGHCTAEQIPGARSIGYPREGHLLVGHINEVRSELHKFLTLMEVCHDIAF